MISITLDDGKTWIPCPDGVRVNIDNLCVDVDNEQTGDLVFNFTHEGVITDIWGKPLNDKFIMRPDGTVELDKEPSDDCLASSAEMYIDIVQRLVSEED